MISLYTSNKEYHELSRLDKYVVDIYHEFCEEFFLSQCNYSELVTNLINADIFKLVDIDDKLINACRCSCQKNNMIMIVLTHPYVYDALRLTNLKTNNRLRKTPFDFPLLDELYGIYIINKLKNEYNRNFKLNRFYSSIDTWDDVLHRMGAYVVEADKKGLTLTRDFCDSLLNQDGIPLLWFYPGGKSRAIEKGGKFKKGFAWIYKYLIENDCVTKFGINDIDIFFVDQYNIHLANGKIVCEFNLLGSINEKEKQEMIKNFSLFPNILLNLVAENRVGSSVSE